MYILETLALWVHMTQAQDKQTQNHNTTQHIKLKRWAAWA